MTTCLRRGPSRSAALIGALLLIGTATCAQPVDGADRLTAEQVATVVQSCYYTSGPLSGSLRRDRPVPIYAPDPYDPWNRLHHLLFSRTIRSEMAHYFRDGQPAELEARLASAASEEERRNLLFDSRILFGPGALLTMERRIGGDAPDFFLHHEVAFLLQDGRRLSALEQLLAEADTETFLKGRSTIARVLLQQDLWNRFDELDSLVRYGDNVTIRGSAERLKTLLGRAITRLACRPEDLARISSNLPAIAAAHTMVDPDLFATDSAWREIVPFKSSSAGTTFHAHTAGCRRLFRAFLRVPPQAGGAQCLEEFFRKYDELGTSSPGLPCFPSNHLAPGSRAILVETLLALSPTGEIVPLPLIFSIELREIRPLVPGPDGRFTLDDIPFFVFHGSRLLFVRSGGRSGGLVEIPADAPVPAHVSAFQSGGRQLVPARLACPHCHDSAGQRLFRRLDEIRVLRPGNTLAQEAVLRAKQIRDDYRDLKRYFPVH